MNWKFWKADPKPSPAELDFMRRHRATLRKAESQGLINSLREGWQKYFGDSGSLTKLTNLESGRGATELRRAIATINAYYNVWGVYREGFDKNDNDRLAQNPIYAICEKAVMDYFATVEWDVTDNTKESVESAVKFLKKPNPQDTLNTLLKQSVRDVIRYDAGAWEMVKYADGTIAEIKAYHGPEFWIEVDNGLSKVEGYNNLVYEGNWSHGYVKRYWQHSRPGIFVPFEFDEICYFMMYPRSDSPYGTDFMQTLKWLLEYLLDSTKAAGMTFSNGVVPGLTWNHPEMVSYDQLLERLKEVELESLGPDNFGGILHTIGQEKIEPITPTLVNMQWLEGQQYVSQLVWAMFGFSPSEFTSGDANRATAYINRNITKSRMLYPLLRMYEAHINDEILPCLDGYQEGWKFAFKESVDLDDELKKANLAEAKARVVQTYVGIGLPADMAMRIADVDKDMVASVKEELEKDLQQMDYQQAMQAMQPGGFGGDQGDDQQGYEDQPYDDSPEDYQGSDQDGAVESAQPPDDDEGIEKASHDLAEYEHEQWVRMTKGIARNKEVSKDTIRKWSKDWRPFDTLSKARKNNYLHAARKRLDSAPNGVIQKGKQDRTKNARLDIFIHTGNDS